VLKAVDAAKYILSYFHCRGENVDKMKLYKLLYYAQGEYLGQNGVPLFEDDIEAWIHGPVVPSVMKYVETKNPEILHPDAKIDKPQFQPEIEQHLQTILETYGKLSSDELKDKTHYEMPWVRTRRGSNGNTKSCKLISQNNLLEFFKKPKIEREEYSRQLKSMKRIIDENRNVLIALAKA